MARLSFIIILLIAFHISYSQKSDKRSLRIGFKTAANFGTLTSAETSYSVAQFCPSGGCTDPPASYRYSIQPWKSRRIGFVIGVAGEKNIGSRNYLLAEFNYELKGIDLEYAENDVAFKQTGNSEYIIANNRYVNRDIRNNYLILSTLFKRTFGEKARFYLVGGFYGGYLIRSVVSGKNMSTTQTFTSPNWTTPSTIEISEQDYNFANAKDQTSPVDIGVAGGGGWQFPLSKVLTLALESRINIGLVPLARENNNQSSPSGTYMGLNSTARNLTLNVAACLFYKI